MHVKDGLYFERLNTGAVHITKRELSEKNSSIQFDMTITPYEWALIVASVCGKGEDTDTVRRAEIFHEIGRHRWPSKI